MICPAICKMEVTAIATGKVAHCAAANESFILSVADYEGVFEFESDSMRNSC